MLGIKNRDFKTHSQVGLDSLMPKKHFYRQLESKLDLSYVRTLVHDFYLPYGRPSIDPVVFFKLQLIMLFEGIRSERQLMEQVQVNLAFRWYIGYDLDELVPDHSSLTRIRERYGLRIFRRFFEQIVQLCKDAGLIWGKELYFDGTQVEANADMDSHLSNFEYQLSHHLNLLFPGEAVKSLERPETDLMETWIEGYQEPLVWQRDPSAYKSIAGQRTSQTDADASPLRSNDKSHLGYHTQYVVDGGLNRVILAALVTPASVQDNQPMLDLARWVRFRWQLPSKIAVGDSKFGSVDNIVGLLSDGLMPLMPRTDYNKGKAFYSNELFRYVPEEDVYYCPQNHVLKRLGQAKNQRLILYQAKAKICASCPVRSACTSNKRGRIVSRSFFQAELDKAAAYRQTDLYKKVMAKRKVWIEPMFAEAKQWHGLRRFRLRRLWRVNIEALLIASVQNIKRLLKPRSAKKNHPGPIATVALSLPQNLFL